MSSADHPHREILLVSDGKPGHVNQSLGLAEALCRQRPELTVREVPAATGPGAWLRALLPARADTDAPALAIGAGHGTHAELLRWRRRGSRAIVLMRPTLPLRYFDLCIEPRHDGGSESESRWLSDGPINRLQPQSPRGDFNMILVGGPSDHYDWDDTALLGQIARICSADSRWVLSTSRRTPPAFLAELEALELPTLEAHAADDLPADWLAKEMPRAAQCWVTPDSASMVYEALTAGCAVGLFDLPAQNHSRVATGVESLVARGLCTRFRDHDRALDRGDELQIPDQAFAEADRLAERILALGWLE